MKTMQKKLMGLILAAAAYGLYKYSRMTPEEKENIKNKGKDFLNKNIGRRFNTAEANRANSY